MNFDNKLIAEYVIYGSPNFKKEIIARMVVQNFNLFLSTQHQFENP